MLDTHRPGCRIHSLLASRYLTASTFCGNSSGRPNFWESKISRACAGDPVDDRSSCSLVSSLMSHNKKTAGGRESRNQGDQVRSGIGYRTCACVGRSASGRYFINLRQHETTALVACNVLM